MAIETIHPVTEEVFAVFDKPSPEQVDDANTGLVQDVTSFGVRPVAWKTQALLCPC